MRYYINTATQSKADDGTYNEYGKKETPGMGEEARISALATLHTTYATMLKTSNVQYWCGKVEDTKGNILDKLECGSYVEATSSEE